ncbi:MAG: FAD-binding protein [Pirellulaceae bacterium]|nr:FAD-binding protein [Pirellulaceae bacterium]
MSEQLETITNFGANISFTPRRVYRPASDFEVLDILRRHKQDQIRVVGRLHAWSPLVESTDVIISLENLKAVEILERDGEKVAIVGAGCQIKRLLAELQKDGLTAPAVGLISEQTIAGAMATATHGSGRQALCHFSRAVRVAHFDSATSEPIISEVRGGEELRAIQCSLGMLGVILRVEICLGTSVFWFNIVSRPKPHAVGWLHSIASTGFSSLTSAYTLYSWCFPVGEKADGA